MTLIITGCSQDYLMRLCCYIMNQAISVYADETGTTPRLTAISD